MPTNDFLPFAYGGSANVETQVAYAAETRLLNGLVSGIVPSNLLNKTLRQSSIMAAVLAQFIADKSGANSVDDGTTATLESNLTAAITAYWALKNGSSANTFLVAPATASGHAVNLGQFASQAVTNTTSTTTCAITYSFTPPSNGKLLIIGHGGSSGGTAALSYSYSGITLTVGQGNNSGNQAIGSFIGSGAVTGGTAYAVTLTQTAGSGTATNNLNGLFIFLPA